jgi:hypothetical protein
VHNSQDAVDMAGFAPNPLLQQDPTAAPSDLGSQLTGELDDDLKKRKLKIQQMQMGQGAQLNPVMLPGMLGGAGGV